jgi:hypothetical protein
VGIGIAKATARGRLTRRRAVTILVERKYPPAEIRPVDRLPRRVGGVAVDVVEVGRICELHAAATSPSGSEGPLRPGSAIWIAGPSGERLWGATLAAFVRSGSQILALTAAGPSADGPLRPRPSAATGGATTLRTLHRMVAGGTVACSAWRLADNFSMTPSRPGPGMTAGVAEARVGSVVCAAGAATPDAAGRIISVDTDVVVAAGARGLLLRHQILIAGSGGPFAIPGDAGSLLVERATGLAVALVVAAGASIAVACHLSDALDALGVRLFVDDRAVPERPTPDSIDYLRPAVRNSLGSVRGPIFSRLAP